MIKLALKHWTFEKCIDILFNGIQRNFIPPKQKYKVGEHFSRIIIRDEFGCSENNVRIWTFFDANILQITYEGLIVDCSYYHIKNNFEMHHGETFRFIREFDGWFYYEGAGLGHRWIAKFDEIVDVQK